MFFCIIRDNPVFKVALIYCIVLLSVFTIRLYLPLFMPMYYIQSFKFDFCYASVVTFTIVSKTSFLFCMAQYIFV